MVALQPDRSDISLKMIAEYLDHALQFEHLATLEDDAKLKADLLKLAASYRKLAEERTKQLGLPLPIDTPHAGVSRRQ